ncbi:MULTISPECIES: hypothetical protein [Roseobacteraceae]|uniref:hypothetical protein n=1 Tax=Roseobacteraceae TaxID=2854170 RepID=UPI0021A57848|nr:MULTISPECIES: hypothetical protein [Roseobacteraceae]UWQ77426.1 hypothetical protein K3724_22875 [Leisingera sp. M658]
MPSIDENKTSNMRAVTKALLVAGLIALGIVHLLSLEFPVRAIVTIIGGGMTVICGAILAGEWFFDRRHNTHSN